MNDFIKAVGIQSAGAVLGAVILPELASSLVGGLGMIAAAGAVSGCFSICAYLGLWGIFYVLPTQQQIALGKFVCENPLSSALTALSLGIGLSVACVFAASIVMGQAFLPLLACTALGAVILSIGLSLISNLFAPPNPSNHDYGFRNG